MITEQQVQEALDWMLTNEDAMAVAKATYHDLDRFSKTIKAELMSKLSGNMSVSARETEALANEEYKTHLDNLRQAEETAQYASGRLETSSKGGRPKKIQAASVTSICAKLFEEISGRHPTFTTDPHTSLISGDWPAFLETVFEALYIDASVASQVRAISQKTI